MFSMDGRKVPEMSASLHVLKFCKWSAVNARQIRHTQEKFAAAQ